MCTGSIGNIDSTIKENVKCKKILTQNIQQIQDTIRRPNLRIIGIDEMEDFQLKRPLNIFKAVREKGQVTYKGRPIRITADFSPQRL